MPSSTITIYGPRISATVFADIPVCRFYGLKHLPRCFLYYMCIHCLCVNIFILSHDLFGRFGCSNKVINVLFRSVEMKNSQVYLYKLRNDGKAPNSIPSIKESYLVIIYVSGLKFCR